MRNIQYFGWCRQRKQLCLFQTCKDWSLQYSWNVFIYPLFQWLEVQCILLFCILITLYGNENSHVSCRGTLKTSFPILLRHSELFKIIYVDNKTLFNNISVTQVLLGDMYFLCFLGQWYHSFSSSCSFCLMVKFRLFGSYIIVGRGRGLLLLLFMLC